MPTWLTPHFSLEELTATQHRRFDNRPPAGPLANLKATAAGLEAVRKILGGLPITVTSGYRSPGLNAAVNGSPTSDHMRGYAADFNCYAFGDPLTVCRKLARAGLAFDQMIKEGTWVHLSFAPAMRGEILTKNPAGPGYLRGLRS